MSGCPGWPKKMVNAYLYKVNSNMLLLITTIAYGQGHIILGQKLDKILGQKSESFCVYF